MTLRDFADRYGAPIAIVVALALLVVLMPSNADKSGTSVNAADTPGLTTSGNDAQGEALTGSDTTVSGDFATAGGGGSSGSGSGTQSSGGTTNIPVGGASHEFGKGPNCRGDGRQLAIALSAPPCVNYTGGANNGGATAPGVTKDKVLIVRFVSQIDPATQAILEGAKLADDPAKVKASYQALFKYYNQHLQTYGREVVFQDYAARGPDDNEEQMRADAAEIATTIKPFAVWGGPKVFGVELASRGIICICTVTLSSEFYQALPPNIFGALPTSTEYAQHLGEYVGKKLAGRNAIFAGDELDATQNYKTKKRVFGLIYIEGAKGKADPEGKRAKDALVAEMAKYGVAFKRTIAYTYDPGRNQQDLTTMIAAMQGDGVTSVLMFTDPLYPILITQEATRQAYFPEWIITGVGLSDTTAAGRLYDQQQWRHAFGISPLWVTWATVAKSYGYRETHHGNPTMPPGDEGVLINIYASIPRHIFTGIHMAGPKLTAASYAAGMFAYPKSGGTPANPTLFYTRQYPTSIKDFVEIYYDGTREGPDERGLRDKGMIMKMAGGKRYVQGQWSRDDTKAFNDPTAIDVSDDPAIGGDPNHEQDGHKHATKCLSC